MWVISQRDLFREDEAVVCCKPFVEVWTKGKEGFSLCCITGSILLLYASTISSECTNRLSIHYSIYVVVVDLGLELNLDELALNLDNVEYEPETFPGLVYRPYESRVSVLVFGNGKLVVAGFRKASEGKKIVKGLMESLREAGRIPRNR